MYPRPDRSDYVPARCRTPRSAVLDVGWNEGTLQDGRPYRLEAWCEDQVTAVTYFFSSLGLERLDGATAAALLEREGLLAFRDPAHRAAHPVRITDAGGNALWSVSVVVGVEDLVFVDDTVPLRPYAPARGERRRA